MNGRGIFICMLAILAFGWSGITSAETGYYSKDVKGRVTEWDCQPAGVYDGIPDGMSNLSEAVRMIKAKKEGFYSLKEKRRNEYSKLSFPLRAKVSVFQEGFAYRPDNLEPWKAEDRLVGLPTTEANWWATIVIFLVPWTFLFFVSVLSQRDNGNFWGGVWLFSFYASIFLVVLSVFLLIPGRDWIQLGVVLFILLSIVAAAGSIYPLYRYWDSGKWLFCLAGLLAGAIVVFSAEFTRRNGLLIDYVAILAGQCVVAYLFARALRWWYQWGVEKEVAAT